MKSRFCVLAGAPVNSFELIRPIVEGVGYTMPQREISVKSAMTLAWCIYAYYGLLHPWLRRSIETAFRPERPAWGGLEGQMVSDAPPFWWTKADWRAYGLWPFSWVYGRISGSRMDHARRVSVSVPVICVGNFTVGGAGKTPTSIDRLEPQADVLRHHACRRYRPQVRRCSTYACHRGHDPCRQVMRWKVMLGFNAAEGCRGNG